MIKLVIFDLDGTLIDSEPLQSRAYRQAYADVLGYGLSDEEYAKKVIIEGNPATSFIVDRKLVPAERIEEARQSIISAKKEVYSRLVRDELNMREGALELLQELKPKIPIALVSSSRIESINEALSKFSIEGHFKSINSCVVAGFSLPKEDMLLKCAKGFNAKPEECVVIEDSPKGLRAAKAAGMKCVICPHKYTIGQDYSEAELVVGSLAELGYDILARL